MGPRSGENIGETPTHVVFIELKETAEPARGAGRLARSTGKSTGKGWAPNTVTSRTGARSYGL